MSKVISKRKAASTRAPRRTPVLVLVSGFVVALLVGALFAFTGGQANGQVSPDHAFHDFGQVPLEGGLVYARFNLAIAEEAAVVTDIQTSCMCTKARVVQGEQVSGWFGMTHGGLPQVVSVPLKPGVPAYLEVEMDPAAHGPAGVGAVERGVIVETAGGQELQFVLAANITP